MTDFALVLVSVYALCCLAVVVSAIRFSQWMQDGHLREKQFYTAVVCAAAAGCSVIPENITPWHGEFFAKPDHWHGEWVARVKADRL